jgi:hypothetical protein
MSWKRPRELSLDRSTGGRGYVDTIGPAYAHTIYAGTPTVMRARPAQIALSRGTGRDARIHQFVDTHLGTGRPSAGPSTASVTWWR